MITLFGDSDFESPVEEDWLNEYIAYVRHQRDPIPSHVKTAVKQYGDAYKGILEHPNVYNHYVPYGRISEALVKLMENHTRNQIIGLLQPLVESFGTGLPYFTNEKIFNHTTFMGPTKIDPRDSKFAFDSWVNHIYQNVCDWPRNIFLGPSIGDRQGKRIDLPFDHTKELSQRLLSAITRFSEKLTMNLDDVHGGLKSYVSGSEDPEYDEKDSKLFETIQKKIKTEDARNTKAVINILKEDDDSYDEYYSEPDDENRYVPHYQIVEKARLAARSRKNQQEGKK